MMINMMHYGSNNGYFLSRSCQAPKNRRNKAGNSGKGTVQQAHLLPSDEEHFEQHHNRRSLYFDVLLLPSEEQELSSVLEQLD